MNRKRIAAFLATAAVICALFWIGGYDFDHRSEMVAVMTAFSIIICSLVAACPFLDKERP